jgi:N-acetylmuramoyl-L-alanine amidase
VKLVQRHSPNFGSRPAGAIVSAVVLHADASHSAAASADWCCKSKAELRTLWERTPAARRPAKPWAPVSYHTIVERDGTLYALVPAAKRAWHAGVSEVAGVPDANDYSVGLCFSNRQDGIERFTDQQYRIGAACVASLMRQFPAIALDRVVTHESCARPLGRKKDPGPLFDVLKFFNIVRQELARR